MKVLFRLLPMLDIAPMAATAMRAAMRPYSMAVAPSSFLISLRNLLMVLLLVPRDSSPGPLSEAARSVLRER